VFSANFEFRGNFETDFQTRPVIGVLVRRKGTARKVQCGFDCRAGRGMWKQARRI
jgi:hypothetical protein